MKHILLAIAVSSLFAMGSAVAQTPAAAPASDASCAAKAVGKDGKPLAGAAKTSSMKKCCTDSALSSDGKPLSGAAKTSYIKKCEAATT
jgi:hypothetical protein